MNPSDETAPIDLSNDQLKSTTEQTSEINGLQSSLETLEEELSKMKDQWLRAVAETENVRRRAEKEKEDTNKYAVSKFAREILSVADNLRRALESCETKEGLPENVLSLLSGIEMTESELLAIFERHGLQKIMPLQQKFDPNLHQAMFEIDNAEVENGTVLQVLQEGYMIHGRLLRPALVGVAKNSTQQPQVKTDLSA